jgi:hypothetical protein
MKHCPSCTCEPRCQGCGARLEEAQAGRPRKWCGRSQCQAQSRAGASGKAGKRSWEVGVIREWDGMLIPGGDPDYKAPR